MNPLLQLHEHGQSYWLDNLTRGMVQSGELARRVTEEGLRGVTSNPAIFQKAISKGREYDEDIERLSREGLSASRIYDRLVVDDIRAACDVLLPLHRESEGTDGFVSLEVSPYLAHDTEGSLDEARRLFRAVERPNVMIKIPGTAAGVPAIEEALFEGIPINITLLFSVASYEAVAEAYLRALERRAEAGLRVDDVASVASFFLSRIDVLVDRLLGHRLRPDPDGDDAPGAERLLGRAAVANAKLAYAGFRRTLQTQRWRALAERGARPQRLLWASTSTKDPLYEEVRYVEPLIGPDTVNTMPEKTIRAFADHGVVAETVEEGLEEARAVMRDLERVGIDFAAVTRQLEDEGVQKFIDPFDTLLGTLSDRRLAALADELSVPDLRAGGLADAHRAVLDALDARQFGRRLAAGDPSLWAGEPEARALVQRRLGWLGAPAAFRERVEEIEAFAREVREEGIRHVALLGMGGSSLAAEVGRDILGAVEGRPELHVLDDTDPEAVRGLEARLALADTLFLVASKSGTTAETLAFYRYFRARVEEDAGVEDAGRRFVAITDPGTPLAEEARTAGFRRIFENPPEVGGRYSALTYFGLVPLALSGVPLAPLLERAEALARCSDPGVPASRDPTVRLGALLGVAARRGRDKVVFLLSDDLRSFGAWVEQLLAESSGKEGRGIVPVVEGAPATEGAPAARGTVGTGDGEPILAGGEDRVFVALRLRGEAPGPDRALERRAEAGDPVVRIELDAPEALGAEWFRWEMATAVACAVLGVNAFDEPNVAESKRNTKELLEARGREGGWPEERPDASDGTLAAFGEAAAGVEDPADAVRGFLAATRPGEYVALLPYCRRTPARHRSLEALRRSAAERTGAAATLGYGPRYLHSTGQLHKGGPPVGRFLLLTFEEQPELPIPGEPYGFGTLQRAQALGDWRALRERGLPVLRLHARGEPEEALARLAGALGAPEAGEPAREPARTAG